MKIFIIDNRLTGRLRYFQDETKARIEFEKLLETNALVKEAYFGSYGGPPSKDHIVQISTTGTYYHAYLYTGELESTTQG